MGDFGFESIYDIWVGIFDGKRFEVTFWVGL